MSRPSRGAWIETYFQHLSILQFARRALRGARGLKQGYGKHSGRTLGSRPSRGAWIETTASVARLVI